MLKYTNIVLASLILVLFTGSIAQANGFVFSRSMAFSIPVSILIGVFIEANIVYGYFRNKFHVGALKFRLFLYALNTITIVLLYVYFVCFVSIFSPILEPYIDYKYAFWLSILSGEILVVLIESFCIYCFLKYTSLRIRNSVLRDCLVASVIGNIASFVSGIIVSIFMFNWGEDLITALFVYFMY